MYAHVTYITLDNVLFPSFQTTMIAQCTHAHIEMNRVASRLQLTHISAAASKTCTCPCRSAPQPRPGSCQSTERCKAAGAFQQRKSPVRILSCLNGYQHKTFKCSMQISESATAQAQTPAKPCSKMYTTIACNTKLPCPRQVHVRYVEGNSIHPIPVIPAGRQKTSYAKVAHRHATICCITIAPMITVRHMLRLHESVHAKGEATTDMPGVNEVCSRPG